MIFNVKEFNKLVEYYYFKMDIFDIVIKMIKCGCYMVLVDLKDVYYIVFIQNDYKNFLKFEFKGCFYKYICFFNGFLSVLCIFIKMFKVVYLILNNQGYISIGYICNVLIIF